MGYDVHVIKDQGFLVPFCRRIFNAAAVLKQRFTPPREDLQDIYPEFERSDILYKYGTYKCFHHAPKDRKPSGAIFILGGRRSKARGNQHVFDVAQRAGLAIIFAELPIKAGEEGLMPNIEAMQDHFLQTLPFYDRYKDVNCYLLGHSTGGTGVARNLKEEATAKLLISRFKKIAMVSTFLKAPFKNSPILEALYEWHAGNHPDMIYGEYWGDRVFGAINKLRGEEMPYEPEEIRDSGYPPHGETLYFSQVIEDVREDLFSSPYPDIVSQSRKISMVHGDRDPFADYRSADMLARHMGVPFVKMEKTFHNPYTRSRINALFSYFFNGPMPQPSPRPSIASKLSGFGGMPLPNFRWMSHRRPENMETDQTPLRERLRHLPILAGRSQNPHP